jgi:hypothetical protein
MISMLLFCFIGRGGAERLIGDHGYAPVSLKVFLTI